MLTERSSRINLLSQLDMYMIALQNIICTYYKWFMTNKQLDNKDYDTQDNKEECTGRYTPQRLIQSRSHKNMKQTGQKERDPQNRHLSYSEAFSVFFSEFFFSKYSFDFAILLASRRWMRCPYLHPNWLAR